MTSLEFFNDLAPQIAKIQGYFRGYLLRKKYVTSIRQEFQKIFEEIENGSSVSLSWKRKKELCKPIFTTESNLETKKNKNRNDNEVLIDKYKSEIEELEVQIRKRKEILKQQFINENFKQF